MLAKKKLAKFGTSGALASAVVLLILLGWGPGDWRGYFANPARSGLIAVAIFGASIASILRLDLAPLRRGQSSIGNQSLVLLILALASLGLIWFLPFADQRSILVFRDNLFLRDAGLAICAAGVAIRLAALARLGKQFSAFVTLQESHELIQTGIYRVIRHPLYLSLLMAGPGFALVFRSQLVLPILAVALVFVASRIREEEKLLHSSFGRTFDEYKNRTWSLLPYVY